MAEMIEEQAKRTKEVSYEISSLSGDVRNSILTQFESSIRAAFPEILSANSRDLEQAQKGGASLSVLDRLKLDAGRLKEACEGILQVRSLPDPIGEVLSETVLTNGLSLKKIRVPLGAIGMIYEGRPNVTIDTAALALKTGNAILLRGSSSALESNRAIVKALRVALKGLDLPEDSVQLVDDPSRECVERMLKLNSCLDVIIPRGGAELISHVVQNATVPVIETGAGNCHVYIDKNASYDMASKIIINAKTQRPSVCNAAEKLILERSWAKEHGAKIVADLQNHGVECLGCSETCSIVSGIKFAKDKDWFTEFLDLKLAIKIVSGVEEAVSHINCHGTKHSESIVTNDSTNAEYFLSRVDAAAVYHNASTRFTDGFQYGFGAEIGISTQKLHARGPMGLPELTSYKYVVRGTGQVRE